MLRVAVAGLRARWLRTALVVVAVGLGSGALGGSMVYADTARAAFFDDLSRASAGVDVATIPTGRSAELDDPAAVVAAQPGVAHVDARADARLPLIGANGRVVANGDQPGHAIAVASWPGLRPYRLVAGAEPTRSGDVALDVPTAQREGFAVGTTVTVVDRDGNHRGMRLVGLVDFGVTQTAADRSELVLVPADLTALATVVGPPTIVVTAAAGWSQETLRTDIAAVIGQGYEVMTGTEMRAELAVAAAKYVDGFLTTLRVTVVVCLGVAALVVYNVFQIMVAHRSREHALLRCIGAARRDIVRLVLIESTLVGLAAGLLGAGIGVCAGALLAIVQRRLPDFHLIVSPLAVLAPIGVGLLATVASATIPAFIAGRVPPVHALHESTDPRPAHGQPRRQLAMLALAAALAVLGGAFARSGFGIGFDGLVRIAAGAMAVFAGVTIALPVVIMPLSAPLRWLLAKTFGATGRLAMGYARRHPVRLSSAAAALMIGIAPLTAFAVMIKTAQDQATRELAENFPIDFVVNNTAPVPLPDAFVSELASSPNFEVAARSRVATYGRYTVGTAELGVLGAQLAVEVREGAIADLRSGTVALDVWLANALEVEVGDSANLGPEGKPWPLRVIAIYDNSPVDAQALVNWSDFDAAGLSGAESLLLRRSPDASAAQAGAALDRAIEAFPTLVSTSMADRRESLTNSLDRRLTQFDVLFGVAVAVSLLGIVNALYLSVLERSHESAMLRALGLSRVQLYRTLLVEAILTALIGALLGVAFGLGFGWVASHELIVTYGHGSPQVPVGTIARYIAFAALGGAAASLWPAYLAARRSVITGLSGP